MIDIGQSILDDIIQANIVYADSPGVVVWAVNSAEILEAISAKYCDELRRRMLLNIEGRSYEE